MPAESEIATLIIKYLHGELSIEEKAELVDWLKQSPEHPKFLETFLTKEGIQERLKILEEMDEAAIWNKLMTLIK